MKNFIGFENWVKSTPILTSLTKIWYYFIISKNTQYINHQRKSSKNYHSILLILTVGQEKLCFK